MKEEVREEFFPYFNRIDTQVRDYCRRYNISFSIDHIENIHRTNIIDICGNIGIPFRFVQRYIVGYNRNIVF